MIQGMYVEIEIITDEYRARAAAALADRTCPDCGRPVVLAPDSYADPYPGTDPEHLTCRKCDTEWRYLHNPDGAEGEQYDWKRSRAGASHIADATGRHPHLAAFTRALTTGDHLDAEHAPVFISVPMARFPATDEENDRISRNGLLLYYPPSMLGDARHDAVAAGQAAAQRAAEGSSAHPMPAADGP